MDRNACEVGMLLFFCDHEHKIRHRAVLAEFERNPATNTTCLLHKTALLPHPLVAVVELVLPEQTSVAHDRVVPDHAGVRSVRVHQLRQTAQQPPQQRHLPQRAHRHRRVSDRTRCLYSDRTHCQRSHYGGARSQRLHSDSCLLFRLMSTNVVGGRNPRGYAVRGHNQTGHAARGRTTRE